MHIEGVYLSDADSVAIESRQLIRVGISYGFAVI